MCQYYTIDVPCGLVNVIIKTVSIDVTRYSLLYAFYTFPSIFTTILGGVFVDHYIGMRLGIVMFVTISAIGHLLFACGALVELFWLMIVGRGVVGIGANLVLITTDACAGRKFKGKKVTFVFSIFEASGLLGSACSVYVNHLFYDYFEFVSEKNVRLFYTLLIPILLHILCFVSAVLFAGLEKVNDEVSASFVFADVASFKFDYWIVIFINILYFSVMYPYQANAQLFYISKFSLSENMANLANALTDILPIITLPCFGFLVSWIGFDAYWGFTGLVIHLGSHLLLIMSQKHLYFPFLASVTMGIGHCMFDTAMWSAPSKLIPENKLITGYGILQTGVSMGLCIMYFTGGLCIDQFGFFFIEVVFSILVAVAIGLLVTFILHTGSPIISSGKSQQRWKNYLVLN